ncbi:hypothetical protein A4X09_0g6920 [Tilletia walkeri]|uniref:Uncharacterized protein n=1 Tax=Tilletia walkeri TaxID=117179 RepID=A0A8X7N2V1_9BASI|nr:hypothetical protein A4X09_0g6920 [Tilletia walkeri]
MFAHVVQAARASSGSTLFYVRANVMASAEDAHVCGGAVSRGERIAGQRKQDRRVRGAHQGLCRAKASESFHQLQTQKFLQISVDLIFRDLVVAISRLA